MLILSRKVGESVTIGDEVTVTVVAVNGNQVRLGINAPRSVRVLRDEIYQAIREENHAAAGVPASDGRLEDVIKRFNVKKTGDEQK